MQNDSALIEYLKSAIGNELHAQFDQFGHLCYLDLSNFGLTQLPLELFQFSYLQVLSLSGNQLTTLPAELGQLSLLQELSLFENRLTALPAEIGQLAHLQELTLHKNQLRTLPTQLGQLSRLRELSLSGNPLIQLPAEIGLLSNLEELLVGNCPLLTPPAEIVAQGTPATLIFLRELHNQHIRRYEGKLIVVGEGGTGKTSLLRVLHGKSFDSDLPTTHGIELDTLSLPHPDESSVTITLNTWDFGGQHIYHATHQFFLYQQ
jgi:internalin A